MHVESVWLHVLPDYVLSAVWVHVLSAYVLSAVWCMYTPMAYCMYKLYGRIIFSPYVLSAAWVNVLTDDVLIVSAWVRVLTDGVLPIVLDDLFRVFSDACAEPGEIGLFIVAPTGVVVEILKQ